MSTCSVIKAFPLILILLTSKALAHTISVTDEHTTSASDVCEVNTILNYDLPYHIAAVFIILVTSGFGVFSALIIGKYPGLKMATYAINIAKYFGTGVILAVGMIHLYPSALFTLTNPCVPASIRVNYAPFAGFLAMLAALVLQFLEYIANWYYQKLTSLPENPDSKHTHLTTSEVKENAQYLSEDGHAHGNIIACQDRRIATYLLEFGIATHSVVIGLSVGVASGPAFTSLLVAIVFHQFFEGIALGVKIGEITYSNRVTPYLVALSYSLITPTGIAIGVGTHGIYNTNSATNLLVIGVLDAISAGILIYMGLVNLISTDFHNSRKFMSEKTSTKCISYIAMWLGAGLMALIGRWA